MPTSIQLDAELLTSLDRVAARKGVSRSRLIYMILKRSVAEHDEWPHMLFYELRESACEERSGGK